MSQEDVEIKLAESQEAIRSGQRRVNLIWEYTQAFVAICIVLSNMILGVFIGINLIHGGKDIQIPGTISSSMFLVIGFYFSRTNHTSTGGVGKKPDEGPYVGR